MSKSSPSLSLEHLHQLRWLCGALLGAVATLTTALLGHGFIWASLGATSLVVLALVRPGWVARVPKWIHQAIFPFCLLFIVGDFFVWREAVPSLIRLGLVLLLYRVWTVRRRRDDLQLIALGLFVLVMTGLLTLSPAFGVALVAFVSLALLLLTLRTLLENAETAENDPDAVLDTAAREIAWPPLVARLNRQGSRKALFLWLALSLGVFPLAWGLFLAMPRFEMSRSLYLERLLSRRGSIGFTDSVRFGDINRLKQDPTVAFRFDPRSPLPPLSSLYWRMALLDEYRDQGFRSSTSLRAFGYSPLSTETRLTGTATTPGGISGIVYFEPGISRHLPLTGDFASLDFSEPRDLRRGLPFHLVSLARDPGSLIAFRIRNMGTGARLDLRTHPVPAKAATFFTQLPLSPEDTARLAEVVRQIGPVTTDRATWVGAASSWLEERHLYSLSSRVPPGSGDPLVRWMLSEEPGHCELFAGSLVLLCRAAGIPARLVAGFAGGTAVDRLILVRNSDAHAWVEFEAQPGLWLRSDPTAFALPAVTETNAAAADELSGEQIWLNWTERLRVAWYRRVVNFDQVDQTRLLQKVEAAGRERWSLVQDFLQPGWTALHQAHSPQRLFFLASALVLVVGGTVLVRVRRHRLSVPPVLRQRREAGRWLTRLPSLATCPEVAPLRADLERIRFGPSESWPDVEEVFRRARRQRSSLAPSATSANAT